jgi:hypothetical protein
MSYNAAMHGNFSAYLSFSHSQQSPATRLNGRRPGGNVDLPAQTAQQISMLQAKLNEKLGTEYISQRPGPGGQGKLTYAVGWKIINPMNEVSELMAGVVLFRRWLSITCVLVKNISV